METPEETNTQTLTIPTDTNAEVEIGGECDIHCKAKRVGDDQYEVTGCQVMPPEEQKPMEARSGDELDKMIDDVVENPPKDQPTM
jgi:hypothetical protein